METSRFVVCLYIFHFIFVKVLSQNPVNFVAVKITPVRRESLESVIFASSLMYIKGNKSARVDLLSYLFG